jgi:hypothetical protein
MDTPAAPAIQQKGAAELLGAVGSGLLATSSGLASLHEAANALDEFDATRKRAHVGGFFDVARPLLIVGAGYGTLPEL